jgi:hypothetical protein
MARLRGLAALIVVAFVLACGAGSSSTGGSGGNGGGTSLPSGFPSDFPVYSGASVSSASTPILAKFDVTWTTSEKAGKLFAYYQTQLASGDWAVQGIAGDATSGGDIDFNRKSDTRFGGTIRLADGKIHVIMGAGCPCEAPT